MKDHENAFIDRMPNWEIVDIGHKNVARAADALAEKADRIAPEFPVLLQRYVFKLMSRQLTPKTAPAAGVSSVSDAPTPHAHFVSAKKRNADDTIGAKIFVMEGNRIVGGQG